VSVFPKGSTSRVDHATAAGRTYDAVVVGAGISGAILASELAHAGNHVLVLEAGPGEDMTLAGYEEYLQRFQATAYKDNQSPYPETPNAPMPRSTDVRTIRDYTPDTRSYIVQNGPFVTDTTYTRVLGGTTLHWEGKTLRMLPEDFELHSRHGVGRDWPVSYHDLEPSYRHAEREIGVSADVEDQAYLGMDFPEGYVFPMKGLPLSYLDRLVARDVDGTKVELDGEEVELKVRPFPQGRNGMPNPAYDGGKGFRPVGAVSTSQVEEGGRCQGNINCVPICPVQAKYNAGKTLAKALRTGRVDVLPQTVASRVVVDPATGQVSGIEVKAYRDPASSDHTTHTVQGRVFVLAANAIENARLMLASGLPSSSGLVGRNLMDHAYLLAWGLLPEIAGTLRGTVCTGGICDLRGGSFRRRQAGFAVDIHNDGWGWATGAPYTDLVSLVDDENRFGADLRRELVARISHQLQLAFMVEVLPSESNRVSVDPALRDALGNMRPVITYDIEGYTLRGVSFARQLSRRIFQRTGARDFTAYESSDYGYVEYDGEGYAIRGGNHLAGTHVMGTSARDSVVDSYQRSWDHQNLYLVGGGSMASVGTSNITLTLAALCFRTAGHIAHRLKKDAEPAQVAV
jgi:choline dehydrogenase-like flavoprotein